MSARAALRAALLLATLWAGAAAAAPRGIHYALALEPDLATRSLRGELRVTLRPDERDPVLRLALNGLRIDTLSADGAALPFTQDADQLQARLPPGTGELSLRYHGQPTRGLVFGPQHVCSAYDTCHWMPCVGELLDAATLDLTLRLPEGYDSLGIGERADPAGHHWQQRRPTALYLFGFAAGRFESALDTEEPRLRYLGVQDDAARLRRLFAPTRAMLAFFEARAGAPLPVPQYSQLLVPGGAAQEVASYSVIGHEMLDPIEQQPDEDWVIAHELAHQWWGNAITCARWSEFWLNEGVTVFMTAAWKQQRWGEAAYQRELSLARQRLQRAVDAGFDKPLAWPGEYPSLALSRAVRYSKGLLFLHALRQDMGEAAFWDGLQRYTRANLGRRVESADLQRAMEAAAGRPLAALFGRWVY